MATYTFANKSSDWADTTNWGGGPPGSSDTVLILQGDRDINLNMDQSAANYAKLVIGPEFRGSLGTPGTPFKCDSDIIKINAPQSRSINIQPTSCPSFTVNGCNAGENGLYIVGGGITSLIVDTAELLRIGAVSITNILAARSLSSQYPLNMHILPGATITNGTFSNANVKSQSNFGTKLEMINSVMDFLAGSVTLASLYQVGGIFNWLGNSSTITLAKVFGGGLLDATKSEDVRTITNGESWSGSLINLGTASNNITVSNPLKRYGGRILGTDSIVTYLEDLSSSGSL